MKRIKMTKLKALEETLVGAVSPGITISLAAVTTQMVSSRYMSNESVMPFIYGILTGAITGAALSYADYKNKTILEPSETTC